MMGEVVLVALGILLGAGGVATWAHREHLLAASRVGVVRHRAPLSGRRDMYLLLRRACPELLIFPGIAFDVLIQTHDRQRVTAEVAALVADAVVCTQDSLDIVAVIVCEQADLSGTASADVRARTLRNAGYRVISWPHERVPTVLDARKAVFGHADDASVTPDVGQAKIWRVK